MLICRNPERVYLFVGAPASWNSYSGDSGNLYIFVAVIEDSRSALRGTFDSLCNLFCSQPCWKQRGYALKGIETPRGRADEESDSVKGFFSVLLAYPAAEPTGLRSPEFKEMREGIFFVSVMRDAGTGYSWSSSLDFARELSADPISVARGKALRNFYSGQERENLLQQEQVTGKNLIGAGNTLFETPRSRAGEESDSVKDFFSVLFAYPATEPTGKRARLSEYKLSAFYFPCEFDGPLDPTDP